MRILVTGASGYVGSRLVPLLLACGVDVRCLTRDPAHLDAASWRREVDVVVGDIADPAVAAKAMTGVQRAYYLVHSLDTSAAFAECERAAAATFGQAAADAGLDRIVYLGGLGADDGLSAHLASRAEVGQVLAASGVPVTTFRAAMIVGAGSTSFELMRYLTERTPVVLGPRRLRALVQPVAVGDVLHYLLAAGRRDRPALGRFDLGGPDRLTYAALIGRYARIAGLRARRVYPLPVPGTTAARLFARAAALLTPMPGPLVRHLVESLGTDVVCTDNGAAVRTFGAPPHGPTGIDRAITRALDGADHAGVDGRRAPWSVQPTDPEWAGGPCHAIARTVRLHRPYSDVLVRLAELAGDPVGLSPAATEALGELGALFGGAGDLPRSQKPALVERCAHAWRLESFRGRRLVLRLSTPRGGVRLEFECSGPQLGLLTERLEFRPGGLGGEMRWRMVARGAAGPCDVLLGELTAARPAQAIAS